jgi:hypothetical protein
VSCLRRLAKNFHDFVDRVPTARGDRHTQALLDLAEVADRFHLPAIQTQDESVLDRNDLQQPVEWSQKNFGVSIGAANLAATLTSEEIDLEVKKVPSGGIPNASIAS